MNTMVGKMRVTAPPAHSLQRIRYAVQGAKDLNVQKRGFAAAPSSVGMLRDESIMEHLVCPISKYPLRYDATRGLIICPEIRVAYPIRDGIPLLIPAEGRILREDEEA